MAEDFGVESIKDNSKVLGVLVVARHGDRQGFYQNPTDYAPTGTKITPLGNQEEYQLGQHLRDRYFNPKSPNFISTVNSGIVNLDEVLVRADAGGEGGVILNSAVSLTQGLFPANKDYKIKLANGTTIEGPLNGYQYVAIESVEPDNDISLEGWTKCGTFEANTKAFYASDPFKAKAAEADKYLKSLPPYLDGRAATLENMWNVFDFMNVQAIHNATFLNRLPKTYLAQARALANWHEYGVFSDDDPNGVGTIAFRTMIPSVSKQLTRISTASDPLKFVYTATSYKPFLSFFNMTSVAKMNPNLAGVVNFAGTFALEVREPKAGGAPFLRFNFKNGTEEKGYKTYPFMDSKSGDVPLQQFLDFIQPYSIKDTTQWCSECKNTKDRGCAEIVHTTVAARALPEAEMTETLAIGSSDMNPVGAGFIGAGVTLLLGLAYVGLRAYRKRKVSLKAYAHEGGVYKDNEITEARF